ncbi:MAG: LamG domain-containing protein [gamma proteobacterium endosymbiont of Lamellibrachia anaximandri]|nr:LamG domain-containing protein [gamma proteobacterium endosymbiont of Lamellibrachia anaximandri]
MNKSMKECVTNPMPGFLRLIGTWRLCLSGLIGISLVTFAQIIPLQAAEKLSSRSIIGYASPLTVRPGDKVDFMTSAIGGGAYEADLVRVVNGDSLSRYREHFRVDPVEAPFTGSYEGKEQPLNLGSYIQVEASKTLDELKSFTVSAWVFPTFTPSEYVPPDLENPDPFSPPTLNIAASIADQTIVSRFDKVSGTGWALQFDKQLRLQFIVGSGGGKLDIVRLTEAARDWDWTYVSASYDADSRMITVTLQEKPWSPGDKFTARNLQAAGTTSQPLLQSGPLRIAALRAGKGAANAEFEKPADVFNGRIQDVRLANRVLSESEVDQLSAEKAPDKLRGSLVGDWDFARGIGTAKIHDVSGNGHIGSVINLPERAIRGVFWNGETINWTDNSDHYDAITFHADDLYNAEWQVDFSYTVPTDLDSGIYAARLKQGDFVEYITFFVAAPVKKPQAKLAVWLSDYNYLAYANITLLATVPQNYPGHSENAVDTEFLKAHLEYGAGGVYNTHVDGSYFNYGTRLRPDIHMKPGGFIYNFPADTHITAFLEQTGIDYDIITDELIDAEGVELLKQYPVVISSTHPEYVTSGMFDSVADYTEQGGRVIYIGGNGWLFSAAGHPSLPGVMESRNFHHIAERYLTNGQRGGLMIETGRHTGPVFGNEMAGMIFNGSSAYRKLEDAGNPRAAWVFADTGEGKVFGDYGIDRVHGGAAGFEIDRYNPDNGVPRHALHLATSEPLKPTIEDVVLGQLPLTIKYHPDKKEPWARADLVFFETANGGAMFSTGSITWISSTLENNFDNDVAKITGNVIRRFLDPKPFPAIPKADIDDVDRALANPEYDVVIDTTKQ